MTKDKESLTSFRQCLSVTRLVSACSNRWSAFFRRLGRVFRVAMLGVRIGLVLLLLALGAIAFGGLNECIFTADVLVVPGNAVSSQGKPSRRLAARLDRAAELYSQGVSSRIIVSGGTGKNGVDEATAMKRYLVKKGLPEAVIIVDSGGVTTRETGRFTGKYLAENKLQSALAVTQYFHVPRTMLALRQAGVGEVGGARAHFVEWRDAYSLLREVPAYVFYLIGLR